MSLGFVLPLGFVLERRSSVPASKFNIFLVRVCRSLSRSDLQPFPVLFLCVIVTSRDLTCDEAKQNHTYYYRIPYSRVCLQGPISQFLCPAVKSAIISYIVKLSREMACVKLLNSRLNHYYYRLCDQRIPRLQHAIIYSYFGSYTLEKCCNVVMMHTVSSGLLCSKIYLLCF